MADKIVTENEKSTVSAEKSVPHEHPRGETPVKEDNASPLNSVDPLKEQNNPEGFAKLPPEESGIPEATDDSVQAAAEHSTNETSGQEEREIPPVTRREDDLKKVELSNRAEEDQNRADSFEHANNNGMPVTPYSNMTREEFIRTMGLTDDDIRFPHPVASGDHLPVRGIELESLIDDDFIRHADLTEPLMAAVMATGSDADSEYRRLQLEKFRETSPGRTSDSGVTNSPDRSLSDPERRHEAHTATEYKSRLLEDFRNRKACGMAKTPERSLQRAQA